METDSLILSMKTRDLVKDLGEKLKPHIMFDFSDLDRTHKALSNGNKRVPGKFEIKAP